MDIIHNCVFKYIKKKEIKNKVCKKKIIKSRKCETDTCKKKKSILSKLLHEIPQKEQT